MDLRSDANRCSYSAFWKGNCPMSGPVPSVITNRSGCADILSHSSLAAAAVGVCVMHTIAALLDLVRQQRTDVCPVRMKIYRQNMPRARIKCQPRPPEADKWR